MATNFILGPCCGHWGVLWLKRGNWRRSGMGGHGERNREREYTTGANRAPESNWLDRLVT